MLPEVGVFAIIVILALAVIYRLEPRLKLLSLSEANRFGAGIECLPCSGPGSA
jgi:hypothetical protein